MQIVRAAILVFPVSWKPAGICALTMPDQAELNLGVHISDCKGEQFVLAALRRHQLVRELLHQRRAGCVEPLAVEDRQALGVAGLKMAQAPVGVRTCSAIS